MTNIERMAREAGLDWLPIKPEQLAKFAALVAEDCAKECESHEAWQDNPALWIATAIRFKYPKEPG